MSWFQKYKRTPIFLDYIESKEPYFERREDAPEIWLKLWELRGNISGWNLR